AAQAPVQTAADWPGEVDRTRSELAGHPRSAGTEVQSSGLRVSRVNLTARTGRPALGHHHKLVSMSDGLLVLVARICHRSTCTPCRYKLGLLCRAQTPRPRDRD